MVMMIYPEIGSYACACYDDDDDDEDDDDIEDMVIARLVRILAMRKAPLESSRSNAHDKYIHELTIIFFSPSTSCH